MEGALELLKVWAIAGGVGSVLVFGVAKAGLGGHDDSDCGYHSL